MDKRIFLVAFIFLFVLISFVNIKSETTPQVTIEKGWNLVTYSTFSGIGDAETYFAKNPMWVLNPIDKKYYGGIGNDAERSIADMFETFDDDFLYSQAFWIYSDEGFKVPLGGPSANEDSLKKIYFLYEGWNLIAPQGFMNGLFLDDFDGDCSVKKIYGFDGDNQKWIDASFLISNEGRFDGLLFSDGSRAADLGIGLAIKVENNCQFDFLGNSGTSGPPVLP